MSSCSSNAAIAAASTNFYLLLNQAENILCLYPQLIQPKNMAIIMAAVQQFLRIKHVEPIIPML
jgi:hypothetical protein